MDERSIDEFESLFESAIRPSVEIEPVEWTRILVSLDGSDRADAATAVALHLAQRVKVPVRFLSTLRMWQGEDQAATKKTLQEWLDAALRKASDAGVQASGITVHGHPGDAIVTEAESEPCSLLIAPTPYGEEDLSDRTTLGVTVDYLLTKLEVPMLLIKEILDNPEQVFAQILMYIPGSFEIGPHFSIPFGMVETSGQLELLHVVEEADIRRVAQALEITPDIDSGKSESIERSIEAHMEHLLGEAVKEVRNESYTCQSVVEVGNPIERVALNLLRAKNTLLVVDSETRSDVPIEAEAYSIVKQIAGVPILVL